MDGSSRFIQKAKDVGLPKDSLERFLAAGYIPQPKQLEFHAACRAADNPANALDIGYGGALGGGKTHCAFAQIAIDDCQRFDDLKVLFLRKVGKYANESVEDLRRSVLKNVKHDFKGGVIHFPNQSRIMVGSYQYEKDIDNYLSLEYDIILKEQSEQITGKKQELINTRNRSSKGFRPRRYSTFNPGGIAHQYLKARFITPFRKGEEKDTKFIFANARDNAFLNEEYLAQLDKLTGWQKAAWRDGDWDILAGQFFSNFRYDKHVIKPFEIPAHWTVWAALDYGFNHPTAVILFAENDGITYIIGEYGARKTLAVSHASAIREMMKGRGVELGRLATFVAGPDAFAQRGAETGKTIADQYNDNGIYLTPANNDRISGAGKLLELFGDYEQTPPIETRLFIFDTCTNVIEQTSAMLHDPNRPEDVLKVDIDDDGNGGDDYYDPTRYGVMAPTGTGIWL